MSDLRLIFDAENLRADLTLLGAEFAPAGLVGADLETDQGLQTAVIVSLFTDRRADPDDRLPDGAGGDRRGWWGDSIPVSVAGQPLVGDLIGSRLWLLSREKQLNEVLNRAREYATEALQWLIDDGVAAGVEVEAAIVREGILGLCITLTRPEGDAVEFRFSTLWENL